MNEKMKTVLCAAKSKLKGKNSFKSTPEQNIWLYEYTNAAEQKCINDLQKLFSMKPSMDQPKLLEAWEKVGPINVKQWVDKKKFDLDINKQIINEQTIRVRHDDTKVSGQISLAVKCYDCEKACKYT